MASGYKNAKTLDYMANAFDAIQKATEEGNNKTGVLPVGQVTGLLHDIPTVEEVIKRIVKEAEGVKNRMDKIF